MLASRILEWARSDPDRTAVIQNDTPVTYGAFSAAIEYLRGILSESGLPAHGVAIVIVKDLLDAWAICLALRAQGLTTIAVADIGQALQLNVRNAVCVVTTRRERSLNNLNGVSAASIRVVAVPAVAFISANPALHREAPVASRPFGGHIVYSSGTTGTFKKVLMGGGTEGARNDWWVRKLSLDRDTVFHAVGFGLWTAAGFGYPSAVWHTGGCIVFDQRQDALRHLLRHPITATFLIPAMITDVLESRGRAAPRADFELMTAGGFLPLALAEQVVERLTGRLLIIYGSTECIAILQEVFRTSDDLYWHTPYSERVVQVVDEQGLECPPGTEGDLRIQLRDVDSTGYLDDEATTARFFRDGYFYPGDLAVTRADGRFRILGRTADVLNVRGVKVPVAPLEDAIQRYLGAEAVCLFSGLADSGSEELVVAIESANAYSGAALDAIARIESLAAVIPAFGGIRYAVLRKFPRTTAGMNKVQRGELRKLVFAKGPDGGT